MSCPFFAHWSVFKNAEKLLSVDINNLLPEGFSFMPDFYMPL